MDFLDNLKDKVVRPFAEIDLQHGIRLVMIVGGYWFLRQAAQRYLAKRQLAQQIEQDRQGKAANYADLVEDPNAEATTTGSEASWGWGKKTRKIVKEHEKAAQEALENLHAETADDDKDIADLLED